MTNAAEQHVHILRHGFPLCKFTVKAPADWPAGHVWVGFGDPEAEAKATCDGCRAAIPEAVVREVIEVPPWLAVRSKLREQGKDLKPLNAEAAAAMGECFWRSISARTSWCEVHGCLRHGTYKDTVYTDDDGKEIRTTSTGYYHPLMGWTEGPVSPTPSKGP